MEVLIVGDYPDQPADSIGRPFAGASLTMLKNVLKVTEIPFENVRFTNLIKCRPKNDKPPSNDCIFACKSYLDAEIAAMPNLKLVIGMGNYPLFAFTEKEGAKRKPAGITSMHGKLIEFEPGKFFMPTHNPASIARNPKFKQDLKEDFIKASKFLRGEIAAKHDTDYEFLYDPMRLVEVLDGMLRNGKPVVFDIETTSKDTPFGTRVLCITLSDKKYSAYYIPINEGDDGNWWINNYGINVWDKIHHILKLFFESDLMKIAHNMKYDISYLEVILGIRVYGLHFDTMLGHFVIDVNNEHGLKSLADRFTDMGRYDDKLDEIIKAINANKKLPPERRNYGSVPVDILREYACMDADATFRLWEDEFKDKIHKNEGFTNVLYNILMPATRVFSDMEMFGINFDVELAKKFSKEYADKLDVIQADIDEFMFISKAKPFESFNEIDTNFHFIDTEERLTRNNKAKVLLEEYLAELVDKKSLSQMIRAKETEDFEDIYFRYIHKFQGFKVICCEKLYKHATLDDNFYILVLNNPGSILGYIIRSKDLPGFVWQSINMQSPKQLKEVLFGAPPFGMGFKPSKLTDTGDASVKEEVIQELAIKHNNPLLNKIVEFRSLSTIKSTFFDGNIESIDPVTGKLHGSFLLHGTKTGRIAGKHPNLLNIPRDEEGEESQIRNLFVPSHGNVFVDADVSQAEFRILGEYCKDPTMLKLFADDVDVHTYLASIIHNKPENQVTKKERSDVKSVVFGLMYGRSTRSVAQQFGMTLADAERIKKQFFDLCPGAAAWLEWQTEFARKHKYVETLFGRRRYLRDISSTDTFIRESAEREAVNTPIQSAASDYVLVALICLYKAMMEKGMKSKIVLTVYDSILIDCPKDEALEVKEMCKYYLSRPISAVSTVIMKCTCDIVDRWSGNKVSEEELLAA